MPTNSPLIFTIGDPLDPPIAGILKYASPSWLPKYLPSSTGTMSSSIIPIGAAKLKTCSPYSKDFLLIGMKLGSK
tara:strand:+ start:1537 stop:1761 length:225 start_codon:yes stop_codon:yes gene_type:complete